MSKKKKLDDVFITLHQAADLLCESYATTQRRIYSGQLLEGVHFYRSGRKILVDKVALIEAVKNGGLNEGKEENNGKHLRQERRSVFEFVSEWQAANKIARPA